MTSSPIPFSRATARGGAIGLVMIALGLGIANPRPASASYSILDSGNTIKIWGTGRNVNSGNAMPVNSSTAEATWKLIAFPNNFIGGTLTDLTLPGNLYIPSRINDNWYSGVSNPCPSSSGTNPNFCASPAISITGDTDTYRWVSYTNYDASGDAVSSGTVYYAQQTPGETYARSYFRSDGDNIAAQPGISLPQIGNPLTNVRPSVSPLEGYRYIIQSQFIPTVTGLYDFSTKVAADNFIEVYLDGTVTGADTATPGIDTTSSGMKLGEIPGGNTTGLFANLSTISNSSIQLNSGQTYKLNLVIYDNFVCTANNCTTNPGTQSFGSTGALIATTAFTRSDPASASVPAPLPLLGAAAFFHRARRLRHRLHSATA